MKRIDFLIAGVQKAGTTSFDRYLRQHPEIAMARRKELHFFDKKPPTPFTGVNHWLYHRAFDWKAQTAGAKLGEATPIYVWWQGAIERIKAYAPDMRLIVSLRDPVERAWSQYQMDEKLGRHSEAFSSLIRQEWEAYPPAEQSRVKSLVSRGLYAGQIARLRASFPDEQLLFVRSEALRDTPDEVMADVCRFLDISPFTFAPEDRHNRAPVSKMISEADKAFLQGVFAEDAAKTRALLGWEQGNWCI